MHVSHKPYYFHKAVPKLNLHHDGKSDHHYFKPHEHGRHSSPIKHHEHHLNQFESLNAFVEIGHEIKACQLNIFDNEGSFLSEFSIKIAFATLQEKKINSILQDIETHSIETLKKFNLMQKHLYSLSKRGPGLFLPFNQMIQLHGPEGIEYYDEMFLADWVIRAGNLTNEKGDVVTVKESWTHDGFGTPKRILKIYSQFKDEQLYLKSKLTGEKHLFFYDNVGHYPYKKLIELFNQFYSSQKKIFEMLLHESKNSLDWHNKINKLWHSLKSPISQFEMKLENHCKHINPIIAYELIEIGEDSRDFSATI